MNDVKKYKLELVTTDDTYIKCRIGELKQAYYKDYSGNLAIFNGACGLLRNEEYKGYCNLCAVYHSNESEHFSNGYTVEFAPLYNEQGQLILIEYDADVTFASVDGGWYDYDLKDIIREARITFWKYGTFTEFNND